MASWCAQSCAYPLTQPEFDETMARLAMLMRVKLSYCEDGVIITTWRHDPPWVN